MLTVLLFGCTRAASVTNPTANQEASLEVEEYEVYSTLINTLHIQDRSKAVAIVSETTIGSVSADNDPDKVFRFLSERMPQNVAPRLIDEFRAKNNQPHKLTQGLI